MSAILYTVGSYLLDRLRELGVRHVCGVPNNYAFPLLDRIEDTPDLTWMGNTNELNAAYAADGYARVHGLAAVVVACGVGELSAANGIAGAFAERVPVVLIAGYPPPRGIGGRGATHHSFDADFSPFPRVMRELTVAQAMLTPANAREEIDRVLRAAWAERRPVHIGLPLDVSELPAEPPAGKLLLPEAASDPRQLAAFLDDFRRRLAAARRPVILADSLVGRYGLVARVQRFAADSGVPFAATFAAKSAFFDESHPQCLGTYMGGTGSPTDRRVEEADLLLRLAVVPCETTTGHADANWSAPHVVDMHVNAARLGGREYPRVALADVLAGLAGQVSPNPAAGLPAAPPIPFEPRPGAALTQERLHAALAAFFRPRDVVAVELGSASAVLAVRMPAEARVIYQWGWMSIGYTVPALLGAQLADRDGRRHVLVIGDGAFQMSAQEVSTYLRHDLAPILIVLHNGRYAVENIIRADGPQQKGYNVLASWDYRRLPELMAADRRPLGLRAATEDELVEGLRAATSAQAEGLLSLLEVVLGPDDFPVVVRENADRFLGKGAG